MLKRDRDPGKILIIGSGVGGLTTGMLFAKLGYPVTIVEKNALPGGLMRGYRRRGYDCPVGIHYLGSLDVGQPLRRLWDYFGVTSLIPLERMGAEGVIDRYIFDDFVFDLPEGVSAFEDNLRRAFPAEQNLISGMMNQLKETCAGISHLETLLSSGGLAVTPESFSPMGEYLDRQGCSERLKSVLGVPATLIGVPLQACPLFYYYMILASYLLSSWRLQSGSSPMAEAFAGRFCALGGELLTGDGVESIFTESGKVKGVRLESGREMAADTVIAAVHPQNVLTMLPEGTLKPDHVERIEQFENTKGLFVVTLAVDRRAHEALPYNLYRIHPEEDGSLLHGSFYQIRRSTHPETHLLTMMATSDIEEWQPWIDTRSGHRGGDYEAAKGRKAAGFIAEAETLFGSLQGAETIDIYTPLTIRDWVGSPGGSAYGIMRSSEQLMKMTFLNRPSIEGLFFAGQNILAPGIMGTTLGSFQVIKRVIGQERFDREVMEGLH
jgi:phytoene dehydrogenase-like protein